MNRLFQFGSLALLAAAAAAVPPAALAGGPPAAEDAAAFFVNSAGASTAHAPQGYLGVNLRDVSQEQLGPLKLKDIHGAEIVLVDHDAPAGKAGLREHDVVLQMNGQPVNGRDQITRMLHDCAPGRTIVLLISRDGQQLTVTTQMSSREAVDRQAWEQHLILPDPGESSESSDSGTVSAPAASAPSVRGGSSFIGSMLPSSTATGAMLEKMPSQLADYFGVAGGRGLLVSSVKPNSPAALAGMHAGDVVVSANQRAVSSSGDWAKAVKSSRGRQLSVVVWRDRKEQTLVLSPDSKKHSSLEFPALPGDAAQPAWIARLGVLFASQS